MASWIVHLRVAEKLLEKIPGLDAGQFAIGNVAPDGGVPDENWEHFEPPKEITHYKEKDTETSLNIFADARFLRDELLEVASLEESPAKFSFLFGYFCHLATDNMWVHRIARPTKERYMPDFENELDYVREVKKDWYGLDFTYVRTHPDCLFWSVFVDAKYTVPYLDFFPAEAIPNQIEYIKNFYQRTDENVEDSLRLGDNIYLNEAEMALFVDGAYRSLLRVYQLIWEQGESVEGLTTALKLLE